jgi:hypothetical protein
MNHLFTPRYDEPTGRYCGPTAICAVTGLLLSDVKAAIRQASGKITDAVGRSHRVSGVANKDLLGALAILGWTPVETWEAPEPIRQWKSDCETGHPNYDRVGRWVRHGAASHPFSDFLREHGHDGPFIINVTGHYIAVGWGELCDPFNPTGTEISRYLARSWKRGKQGRYQNAWVQRWWKFEQVQA